MSSQINILEIILRSNRSVFNDHITVKFVLKLFQTYITSDYFLYLCNGLTSIAIPEANDLTYGGVDRIRSIVKRLKLLVSDKKLS